MRVMINLLSVGSGGAKTYVTYLLPTLVSLLADKGSTIEVIYHRSLTLPPLRATLLPLSFKTTASRLAWERAKLQCLVDSRKVEVVFTPYQVTPLVQRAKNVVMARNMEPFFHWRYPYPFSLRVRNEVLRRLTIITTRRAQRVIAVSQFAADQIVQSAGVDRSRIRVIAHGADHVPLAYGGGARDVSQDLPFTVVSAGSMLPYRRVEDVLAACEHLANLLRRDVRVFVAGAGQDRQYADKVARLAAKMNCVKAEIIGPIAQDELFRLMRDCDAFVFSSEVEACPNILLEAMRCAGAIVAASTSSNREFLRGAGMYYEPRDIQGLANALVVIASNANGERRRLRDSASELSKSYLWRETAELTSEAVTCW